MINLGNIVSGLASRGLKGFGIEGGTYGPSNGSPSYMVHVNAPERNIHVKGFLPENFSAGANSDYDTPFADGFLPVPELLKLGMRLGGYSTTTQMMTMLVWQGSSSMDFSIPMTFLLDTDPEKDVIGPVRSLLSLTLPSVDQEHQGMLQSPGPKIEMADGTKSLDIGKRMMGSITSAAGGAGQMFGDGIGALFNGTNAEQAVNDPGQAAATVGQNAGNISGTDINSGFDKVMGGLNELYATFNNLISVRDNISLQIGSFMFFPSVVIKNVDFDFEVKLDRYRQKPIALEVTVAFATFTAPTSNDLNTMLPR